MIKPGDPVSSNMQKTLVPPSAPRAVRELLLQSRPAQDQAHDVINAWLDSDLQSYAEEGQRMLDAANEVHPPRRPVALETIAHTFSRREEDERPLSPLSHSEDASIPWDEDSADIRPHQTGAIHSQGVVRHVTINGANHQIFLNSGTGQQNVDLHYHADSKSERYNGSSGDERYGGHEGNRNDKHSNDSSYEGDNENRSNIGNDRNYNPVYRQPERGRGGQDDARDDAHNTRDSGRQTQRDRSRDGRKNDRYDDGYDIRYRREERSRDGRGSGRYEDDYNEPAHGRYAGRNDDRDLHPQELRGYQPRLRYDDDDSDDSGW